MALKNIEPRHSRVRGGKIWLWFAEQMDVPGVVLWDLDNMKGRTEGRDSKSTTDSYSDGI